ncbi:hypothetical protein ATO00_10650 [Loigolactobacillus coryniformis subsp. coryniformis]|nr:hypothetical protein ATO00_10650 [Loigolactobacillus coryniformis subsp. coryniformis]
MPAPLSKQNKMPAPAALLAVGALAVTGGLLLSNDQPVAAAATTATATPNSDSMAPVTTAQNAVTSAATSQTAASQTLQSAQEQATSANTVVNSADAQVAVAASNVTRASANVDVQQAHQTQATSANVSAQQQTMRKPKVRLRLRNKLLLPAKRWLPVRLAKPVRRKLKSTQQPVPRSPRK